MYTATVFNNKFNTILLQLLTVTFKLFGINN